jgi:hypothetical protein
MFWEYFWPVWIGFAQVGISIGFNIFHSPLILQCNDNILRKQREMQANCYFYVACVI